MDTIVDAPADDGLLEGAGAIAFERWGVDDRRHRRRVYTNAEGLPLFRWRGQVCAFKSALDAHAVALAAKREALRIEMEKAAAEQATLNISREPRPRRRATESAPESSRA
jgi:hypothetical protein